MFSHRSSAKKNKPFKSKFATKSSLKTKGIKKKTIAAKSSAKNSKKPMVKPVKLNSPLITAIVPLCPDCDSAKLLQSFVAALGVEYSEKITAFKKSMHFIPTNRNLLEIMDAVRISDSIIFLVSANVEVDKFGELCMSTIKSIGVPNVTTIVQHLENHPPKMQHSIRNSLLYFMSHHFPLEEKLFSDSSDQMAALRHLSNQNLKGVVWRDRHAYIVSDRYEYADGILSFTGHVRGSNLSPNRLLHIPDLGDFQIEKIFVHDDNEFVFPNADIQQDLLVENPVDPLDAEQTWPTEQEILDAEERVRASEHEKEEKPFSNLKRVPKGTSAYQAAWIFEEYSNDEEDTEMHQADELSGMENDNESNPESEYEEIDLTQEEKSLNENELPEEEEQKQLAEYLERQRASRDHQEFPDEIDTPQHMPALERFAKYRGLKSFRSSPWNPYENLPPEYGRIFQFQNFKKSKKMAFETLKDGIPAGTLVTITLNNVPKLHSGIISSFQLLPNEQKLTVSHFSVQRNKEYQEPIKSKDKLIMFSGFRRYVVSPIYTLHERGGSNNVHKFARFMDHGRPHVGTVYAPTQYGPAPVLLFQYTETATWTPENCQQLVGTGDVLQPDPLYIVAKRVVLTGHPFRIHKRHVTVRFMFHNKKDIDYFKPIQLQTKHGHVGHIKESLGTHGYMKCVFNSQLKQHDTVKMCLYKRIFPKVSELWNSKN